MLLRTRRPYPLLLVLLVCGCNDPPQCFTDLDNDGYGDPEATVSCDTGVNDALDCAAEFSALVGCKVFRSRDDDGDIAPCFFLAQFVHECEAVHDRHHEVEENQTRMLPLDAFQCLLAVRCLKYAAIFFLQDASEPFPGLLIIVDHQNTACRR